MNTRLTSDMENIVMDTPILTCNTQNNQSSEHERENEEHQHVEEEEEEEISRIMGTEEEVLTPDTSVREFRITFGKFLLRSHSTGHSLLQQPLHNLNTHTLRLAEHDVVLPGVWSSKTTWMTPPFVSSGWGKTTCWTPLRMSFCNTKGSQKPFHLLPL
ncbi:hypothetical protein Lalb_Chr23g0277591 [Lupinus albus]|uniref:Uncharacterized protein n=1 Tax=Lupinus albus TaxID=3870 RepID=A0A6A4NEE6_LUPAL|nr:hypothetical protein Lalb_Chr23g0277591 [Lupinus albus]